MKKQYHMIPCCKCGENQQVLERHSTSLGHGASIIQYSVFCASCGHGSGQHNMEELAVAHWNTREFSSVWVANK